MKRGHTRRLQLGEDFLGLLLALGAVAVAVTGPLMPVGGLSAPGGLSLQAAELLSVSDAAMLALLLLATAGLAAVGRRRQTPA